MGSAHLGVGAAVAVFTVWPLEIRAVVAHCLADCRAVRRGTGGDGHLRELQAVVHGLGGSQVEIVLPDTLHTFRSARWLGGSTAVATDADARKDSVVVIKDLPSIARDTVPSRGRLRWLLRNDHPRDGNCM